jgi:hypothetical protein
MTNAHIGFDASALLWPDRTEAADNGRPKPGERVNRLHFERENWRAATAPRLQARREMAVELP